jgi:hypothetical protein
MSGRRTSSGTLEARRIVKSGDSAAFSVDAGDGERVVVAVVARVAGEEARVTLARDVAGAVREAIAVDCDVVLVPPATGLPMTSSGKLSRSRARSNFLAGRYDAKPPRPDVRKAGGGHRRDRLRRPAPDRRLARHGWRCACWSGAGRPCPRWPASMPRSSGATLRTRRPEPLVEGADAVVHAAGLIKARRPESSCGQPRRHRPPVGAGPDVPFLLLSSLAAREPQLSPYAASKRRRRKRCAPAGPWLRRPCAGGLRAGRPRDPGLLSGWPARVCPAARPAEARLSLIHVEDLAEALALALDRRPPSDLSKSTMARGRLQPRGHGGGGGRGLGRPVALGPA